VLQFHFNWKTLSAIAGITWLTFYFRLFPGTGDLLVIWDGLRSHRSLLVRDFVRQTNGRLELEFLPGYAPELNPVEYIWGHWKHHELPNFCAKNLWQLSEHARKALRRMRRRPTLVSAFWKQADLF